MERRKDLEYSDVAKLVLHFICGDVVEYCQSSADDLVRRTMDRDDDPAMLLS